MGVYLYFHFTLFFIIPTSCDIEAHKIVMNHASSYGESQRLSWALSDSRVFSPIAIAGGLQGSRQKGDVLQNYTQSLVQKTSGNVGYLFRSLKDYL